MKKLIFILFLSTPTILVGQNLPPFYHNYEEVMDSLWTLESLYSNIMEVFPIGVSTEDEDTIYVVKVSNDVSQNRDVTRLLFVGQVHAEENIGVELTLDMITDIVTHWYMIPWNMFLYLSEMYFIPTLNPEGFKVVTDGWDITYRKNKRDNVGDGIFRYLPGVGYDSSGVDLNRNFDINWIHGDTLFQPGSVELYDYYRGSAPFSENETSILKEFAQEKHFSLGIIYHQSRQGTVSENVIYPWNWAGSKYSPDIDIIENIGTELASMMHKLENPGQTYEPHASSNFCGNSQDWFYADLNCYQYTVETSSIQPADSAILNDIIEDNEDGIMFIIRRAIGDGETLEDVGQLTGVIKDAQTGQSLDAEVRLLGRTSGMLQSRRTLPEFGRYRFYLLHGNYQLQVSKPGYATLDTTISVSQNYPTVRNLFLQPLPQYIVQGMITDLDTQQPIDATLYFNGNIEDTVVTTDGYFSLELPESPYSLRIDAEGYVSFFQDIVLSQPLTLNRELSPVQEIFIDDFESGGGNWTIGGNSPWGIDYTQAHSGGASFADSPGADYEENDSSFVETVLDLSGFVTAHLRFWHRYYLEPEYDWARVQVSLDDGFNWTILDSFDLQNVDWKPETYNLSNFCGNQIKLRFYLNTDENINESGWNIDDVSVAASNRVSVAPHFELSQKFLKLEKLYPNPFNSSTLIRYSLEKSGFAEMIVYNVLGERVETLLCGNFPEGDGIVKWKAESFPSGLYFIQLRTENRSLIEKCLLVK